MCVFITVFWKPILTDFVVQSALNGSFPKVINIASISNQKIREIQQVLIQIWERDLILRKDFKKARLLSNFAVW